MQEKVKSKFTPQGIIAFLPLIAVRTEMNSYKIDIVKLALKLEYAVTFLEDHSPVCGATLTPWSDDQSSEQGRQQAKLHEARFSISSSVTPVQPGASLKTNSHPPTKTRSLSYSTNGANSSYSI